MATNVSSDQSAPPSPLTEFTLFPTLPFELRAHIWSLVDFESRFIVMGNPAKAKRFKSQRPPAILGTNQESRMVGLNSYKLFKWLDHSVMINWKLDILIIEQRPSFEPTLWYIKQTIEEAPEIFEKCNTLAISMDRELAAFGDFLARFRTLHRTIFYYEFGLEIPWDNPSQIGFVEFSAKQKDGQWYPRMEMYIRDIKAQANNTIMDATPWLLIDRKKCGKDTTDLGGGFYSNPN